MDNHSSLPSSGMYHCSHTLHRIEGLRFQVADYRAPQSRHPAVGVDEQYIIGVARRIERQNRGGGAELQDWILAGSERPQGLRTEICRWPPRFKILAATRGRAVLVAKKTS